MSARSRSSSPISSRSLALKILKRVEEGDQYVHELLEAQLTEDGGLDLRDRAFVRELVLGTLRWQGRLDWILSQFLRRDLRDLPVRIRTILRLGVYQILFMDRVPPHAAVSESVRLAKRYGHRGTAALVNAVLRRVAEPHGSIPYPDATQDPIAYLSVVWSHPLWLVERWIARFGVEETEQICRANAERRPLSIRVNTLITSTEALLERLSTEGFRGTLHPLVPGFVVLHEAEGVFQTAVYREGWFQVQDPSAALPSLLLDPQPGETILDLCAAPGGKTTHLAQLMEDRGRIVALDPTPLRLQKLIRNVARLGLRIVQPVAMDALRYTEAGFDRILLDAPCSGTGVLSKKVDIRWNLTPGRIEKLVELQHALLGHASTLLKVGGTLVYSTCSIEEEEDESVIQCFLQQHSGFVLESASEWIPIEETDLYVHTYPHRHGADGSFAARLRRKA